MKSLQFSRWICLLFSMLAFACSDPDEPNAPDPTKPVGKGGPTAQLVDVSVVLPPNSKLDLSKTTLSTGLMTFPVSAAGLSKAVLPDSVTRLAFLFDESNKLILMGVLSDQNKTINTETTAQALFYLGVGVFYMPKEVVNDFLRPSMTLPGYDEFKAKVEAGFKNDILYLENLNFQQDLTDLLSEYSMQGEILDIRSRQIDVDPNGFQSGIQIFENDALSIKIANHYRRIGKAFIYKTAYKAKGSKDEVILIPSIGPGQAASSASDVDGTKGFSSTLGTIVDQLSGNGIEYARKESGPIPLALGDNEDEAIYKVRVVGSAFRPAASVTMTNAEKEAWQKLMLKQFYTDFVLPILSEILSEIKGAQDASLAFEAFEATLSQSPAILDLVFSGNFKKATEDFIKFMVVDKGGQKFQEEFIKKVVDKYKNLNKPTWIDLDRDYNNAAAVDKYLKIIKAVEMCVKLLDMGKLTTELIMSDRIVEFTAKARRTDVKINPAQETTVPFAYVPLKVETKTQLSVGQSFLYKWSTTGKYGVVTATGGLKGPSIETSSATVNFRSEVNSADLGENNYEKVKVEVYVKKGVELTLIGDATATINVKKVKLSMKPDGISLDGKQKQSLRLYLERSDNVNDIVSTSALEYKVEWSTEGKHGMFDGKNTIATTRGNAINYQALDGDVREGREEITASVYFRVPGSGDWTLREKVTGSVKIINDPKKVILNVALTAKSWDNSSATSCNPGVNYVAIVPIHPKAVRYTVTFYGFSIPWSWEGRSGSWSATKGPPSVYGYPPAAANEIVGDSYYYTISRSWGAGPMNESCAGNIPKWTAYYQQFGGRANIVIDITD